MGVRVLPRRLRALSPPFTYPEVGATDGTLPLGYAHLDRRDPIGRGRAWFAVAAERLLTWDMHRRAGLGVARPARAVRDEVAVLTVALGPLRIAAPVRVVDVVAEDDRVSMAYGTLPGHPECGEESFTVRLRADDRVELAIRAFSRPGRWFTRLGAPVARRVQAQVTDHYVAALTQPT